MNKFKICFLVSAILLGGCSSLEYDPNKPYVAGIHKYIDGFPELTVIKNLVNQDEIEKICTTKDNLRYSEEIVACASISFENKTCNIYLPKRYRQWMLDHEQAHCRGGDHGGVLQAAFDRWKKIAHNSEIKVSKENEK